MRTILSFFLICIVLSTAQFYPGYYSIYGPSYIPPAYPPPFYGYNNPYPYYRRYHPLTAILTGALTGAMFGAFSGK